MIRIDTGGAETYTFHVRNECKLVEALKYADDVKKIDDCNTFQPTENAVPCSAQVKVTVSGREMSS